MRTGHLWSVFQPIQYVEANVSGQAIGQPVSQRGPQDGPGVRKRVSCDGADLSDGWDGLSDGVTGGVDETCQLVELLWVMVEGTIFGKLEQAGRLGRDVWKFVQPRGPYELVESFAKF